MGFNEPSKAIAIVKNWHYGGYLATRAAAARAHLTELPPSLLRTLAEAKTPTTRSSASTSSLSRLPAGVQLFAAFAGARRPAEPARRR